MPGGCRKVYSPDGPQALEVPKDVAYQNDQSVQVGSSGPENTLSEWKTSQGRRMWGRTSLAGHVILVSSDMFLCNW